MWGMKLSLPLPQCGLLRKALGLQMQVFPMIPRQAYFIGTPDIAFILPWLDHSGERARSSDKAASERRSKDAHWSVGWTTMGSSPCKSLRHLSAGGFGPKVHPPLSQQSTTARVLPALHLLPERSTEEDLLLFTLQILYSIYLEVNLAKISLLSPERSVGKWEGRRPSRSVSTGSFPGFPVSTQNHHHQWTPGSTFVYWWIDSWIFLLHVIPTVPHSYRQ